MESGGKFGSSLVAQMVKNLPAMQETRVQSLGREDPLERGHGNPLQYSCLENPMDRGAWQATVHGSQRVGHDWATKTFWRLKTMVVADRNLFEIHRFLARLLLASLFLSFSFSAGWVNLCSGWVVSGYWQSLFTGFCIFIERAGK